MEEFNLKRQDQTPKTHIRHKKRCLTFLISMIHLRIKEKKIIQIKCVHIVYTTYCIGQGGGEVFTWFVGLFSAFSIFKNVFNPILVGLFLLNITDSPPPPGISEDKAHTRLCYTCLRTNFLSPIQWNRIWNPETSTSALLSTFIKVAKCPKNVSGKSHLSFWWSDQHIWSSVGKVKGGWLLWQG